MYEFRFYAVEHGRMAEELKLVYDMGIAGAPDVPGGPPVHKDDLWKRYGVPRPVGSWSVTAGNRVPGFLYIIKWNSLTERDANFPRFWTDPFWRARRGQITDGMTLVNSIETWLCDPSALWSKVREGGTTAPLGGVHEMLVQEVLNGSVPDAIGAAADVEIPYLKQHGAKVLSVLDVVIGPRRPLLVTMLAWPDVMTQQAAWKAFDAEPTIIARRAADAQRLGRPVILSTDKYLLQPMEWNTPVENFGAAP